MSIDAVPDTPEEAVRIEAEDHVSDIMFDATESPDPDCMLCKAAIGLGIWAAYGICDPFDPDEE